MFGNGRLPLEHDPNVRFASSLRALSLLSLSAIVVMALVRWGET